MKKLLILLVLPLLLGAACSKQTTTNQNTNTNNTNILVDDNPIQKPEIKISSFEECEAAGNPVMESFPRKCEHNGKTYTEVLPEPLPIDPEYSHEGLLKDVTGGEASGKAMAMYNKDSVLLYAESLNLPELEDDYFYEGWLVRNEPFDFISTGKAYFSNEIGEFVNEFEITGDYQDYTFYVLTLEPDDGDPAPADHIIEGDLIKK